MIYAEWLAAHLQTWGSLPSPGEAWEFSERQALERAAEECEALEARISKAMVDAHDRNGAPIDGGYLNACDDCAEVIRALIEGASGVASKED